MTPGDVSDNRLAHPLLDELGGALLGVSADLAHQDDDVGVGIVLELLEDVDEIGTGDRVAADPDAGRLSDAALSQLVNDLIGQRPRARDEPDWARLADLAGDDPDVGLTGRDDAGAIRADQRGPSSRVRM